jgi:hypothetical protein
MDRAALEPLSKDQLIELVLSLLQRVADLEARIDELTRPAKTPDNSAMPPSRGRKANAMPPTPAKAGGGGARAVPASHRGCIPILTGWSMPRLRLVRTVGR